MGMHAAWAAERKAALRGTRRHGGATAQHKTVTHWQPTCLVLAKVDTFMNNKTMCPIMRKSPTKYSEEFKLSVLRDYYSSGMSKRKCAQKYGLCNSTLLSSWLSRYGDKSVSLPSEENETDMARRSNEYYKAENAELRKRIRELEKALSYSRLETEARDVMIEIAEREFDIRIRKKRGAKQ